MNRIKRVLCLCLATVLLAGSLAGCGGSPERDIERLTQRFCDSYNELDLEVMMECLEPSMANTIEAMIDLSIGLVGSMLDMDIGLDAETMYSLAAVCFDVMPEGSEYLSGYPYLEIELEDIRVDDYEENAVAQAVITMTINDQTQVYNEPIYFVVVDGDWCISNANFQMAY